MSPIDVGHSEACWVPAALCPGPQLVLSWFCRVAACPQRHQCDDDLHVDMTAVGNFPECS